MEQSETGPEARITLADVAEPTASDLAILSAVQNEALSAEELAERLDVSEPTVYRHVNSLHRRGLLSAERRIAVDGPDSRVYRSEVEGFEVKTDPDGVRILPEWREDVDRATNGGDGRRR